MAEQWLRFVTLLPRYVNGFVKIAVMKNKKLDIIELIAAKELLRRWMRKHRGIYAPGAWDYDKDGADLMEQTGKLLEEDPWQGRL